MRQSQLPFAFLALALLVSCSDKTTKTEEPAPEKQVKDGPTGTKNPRNQGSQNERRQKTKTVDLRPYVDAVIDVPQGISIKEGRGRLGVDLKFPNGTLEIRAQSEPSDLKGLRDFYNERLKLTHTFADNESEFSFESEDEFAGRKLYRLLMERAVGLWPVFCTTDEVKSKHDFEGIRDALKTLRLPPDMKIDAKRRSAAISKLKAAEVNLSLKWTRFHRPSVDFGLRSELTEEVFAALTELPELRDVSIWDHYGKISPAAMKYVLRLPSIRVLMLTGKRFDDSILAQISSFKHVYFLSIKDTSITDSTLVRVGRMPKLTALSLAGSVRVSSAGLKNLSGLKSLINLSIGGTRVEDGAVPFLERLPKLSTLDISAGQLSKGAIEMLRKRKPDLLIDVKKMD